MQANKVDPETALRVILMRAGTKDERTAASRPFHRAAAETPADTDMRTVGSIEVAGAGQDPGPSQREIEPESDDPGRPTLKRKDDDAAPTAAPAPARDVNSVDDVIAEARSAADSLTQQIPNSSSSR